VYYEASGKKKRRVDQKKHRSEMVSAGGVPPDQVKGNLTLASGYSGQVNVSVCAEMTFAKARATTKAPSSGREGDSTVVGSKEQRGLG